MDESKQSDTGQTSGSTDVEKGNKQVSERQMTDRTPDSTDVEKQTG